MEEGKIKKLLQDLLEGRVGVEEVISRLKALPFERLGEAVLDTHRALRTGFPEIIYAEGKSRSMLISLIKASLKKCEAMLATRVLEKDGKAIEQKIKKVKYNPTAKVLHTPYPEKKTRCHVCVITAGASDIPVAAEAEITCRMMGVPVHLITDVGIAGIHRITEHLPLIAEAACAIVAAGMEGALPGVIAGMVGIPVIGLPVAHGYGVSGGGLTALLSMLASCAPNVVTVNINDGVGAGFTASLIALRAGK